MVGWRRRTHSLQIDECTSFPEWYGWGTIRKATILKHQIDSIPNFCTCLITCDYYYLKFPRFYMQLNADIYNE